MDNDQTPQSSPSSSSHTIPIRIHKSTARTLRSLVSKANKKPLGKRIKSDQIIAKALSLLTDLHLEEIKEASYEGKDHFEIKYRNFCEKHGSISKDEFLKKLLSGLEDKPSQ